MQPSNGPAVRLEKLTKRAVVHAAWLLIAVATGGAWVFYYADAPTLMVGLVTLTAPAVAGRRPASTVHVLTAGSAPPATVLARAVESVVRGSRYWPEGCDSPWGGPARGP